MLKSPALFILIFYADLRGLDSHNSWNSSYKEKTAGSACVSRLAFHFLWLCLNNSAANVWKSIWWTENKPCAPNKNDEKWPSTVNKYLTIPRGDTFCSLIFCNEAFRLVGGNWIAHLQIYEPYFFPFDILLNGDNPSQRFKNVKNSQFHYLLYFFGMFIVIEYVKYAHYEVFQIYITLKLI